MTPANPFEVLELRAAATARDVTRERDKLLGMLELGLERARRYTSSSAGAQERTAELVRSAAQELERPRSRLVWELWLEPSEAEVEADRDLAPMRTALLLHQRLSRQVAEGAAFGLDDLEALGEAWDEALESEGLRDRITSRAIDLGVGDDEVDLVAELRAQVSAQVLTLLERGPVLDLDELSSELATDAAHAFAARKVELLGLVCARMTDAAAPSPQRQPQWRGLVREYAALVLGRGDHLRRTAFHAVMPRLSSFACDLHNDRVDSELALEMFRWLRDEAAELHDEAAMELNAKNAGIVQGQLTRRGRPAAGVGGPPPPPAAPLGPTTLAPPVITAPVITAPTISAPTITAPTITAPTITAPTLSAPTITAPTITAPPITAPRK